MDLLICSHLWQAPITSRVSLATQMLVSCVPRPGFRLQCCKAAANFNVRLVMFPNEKKKKQQKNPVSNHQGTPERNQSLDSCFPVLCWAPPSCLALVFHHAFAPHHKWYPSTSAIGVPPIPFQPRQQKRKQTKCPPGLVFLSGQKSSTDAYKSLCSKETLFCLFVNQFNPPDPRTGQPRQLSAGRSSPYLQQEPFSSSQKQHISCYSEKLTTWHQGKIILSCTLGT